jgi:prepilin-type N-terminal cleavage/methylation domain-containing protein
VELMNIIKRIKGNQRGFSLTEVVIAMAIFGVVGISVMIALNASSKTITSAHEITIAESVTRTEIEYIKRSAYDSGIITTNLSGDITSGDTVISVDDASAFDTSGIIQIDDELIQYAGKTGSSFNGCERGFNSTTAADHLNNTPVADTPEYTVPTDLDLNADPFYGDYGIAIIGMRLDPEGDGTDDDDGEQKITIVVTYHGRQILATTAYKVDR